MRITDQLKVTIKDSHGNVSSIFYHKDNIRLPKTRFIQGLARAFKSSFFWVYSKRNNQVYSNYLPVFGFYDPCVYGSGNDESYTLSLVADFIIARINRGEVITLSKNVSDPNMEYVLVLEHCTDGESSLQLDTVEDCTLLTDYKLDDQHVTTLIRKSF